MCEPKESKVNLPDYTATDVSVILRDTPVRK